MPHENRFHLIPGRADVDGRRSIGRLEERRRNNDGDRKPEDLEGLQGVGFRRGYCSVFCHWGGWTGIEIFSTCAPPLDKL